MVLDLGFVEVLIVERTECRCHAAEGSDESKLRRKAVADEAKPRFQCKVEAILGMALHVYERIPRREKVSSQAVATVRGESEDTCLIRNLESAMQQITAGSKGLRPRHDAVRKGQIGSGQKARQPAAFDQVAANPAQSIPIRVVAKLHTGYHAKYHISDTRTIAVTVLETEASSSTGDQGNASSHRSKVLPVRPS